ncbi:MAG: hypothetical protein PHW92_15420 [Lutibacter sp.]|nr:hypothetical protein [Lutibacter sp.]
MNTKTQTDLNIDSKYKQIQAILFLLQENLDEFKDEVDRSYELLKIGELTGLAKKIEKTINRPFENIIEISDDIDDKVRQIVNGLVIFFFKKRKDIIFSAHKCKTPLNDLYYAIVLNEDNIDNREKIMEFFDKFDLLNISNKYPVYFQFVPKELCNKINCTEEICLD